MFFSQHCLVTLELKVQRDFGVTLKFKRQDAVFSSPFYFIGSVRVQKRDSSKKTLFPIDFDEARDM